MDLQMDLLEATVSLEKCLCSVWDAILRHCLLEEQTSLPKPYRRRALPIQTAPFANLLCTSLLTLLEEATGRMYHGARLPLLVTAETSASCLWFGANLPDDCTDRQNGNDHMSCCWNYC
jgi:hypothetical protein